MIVIGAEVEDAKRDFGVQALTEAWDSQDIHRLNGAFSLCVVLECVDAEIRDWYVSAWKRLVVTYQAEGRSWTRKRPSQNETPK